MSIEATINGPILEVTINRPKANAIDAETSREMGRVFAEFRDDPQLRVAILTGAGDRFFSAGWDLKAAADGEDYESDYGVGGFGGFPELPGLNKPVIVAVNGIAAGGGFELVLAAHFAVAADTAEFFFGETAAGVIPDAGTVRLPRLLTDKVANDLLITGRRVKAEEAMSLGLINQTCSKVVVMRTAHELADRILAAAPLAVAAIIESVRVTKHLPLDEAYSKLRSGSAYQDMVNSEDAQEGPRAFAEGRDPKWQGR